MVDNDHSSFSSVFMVDVAADEYTAQHMNPVFGGSYARRGCWSELLAHYTDEIVHPDDRDVFMRQMGEKGLWSTFDGTVTMAGFDYRRLVDGTVSFNRINVVLIEQDDEGHAAKYMVTMTDVTAETLERQRRELLESYQRGFRQGMSIIHDGEYLMDLDTNRYYSFKTGRAFRDAMPDEGVTSDFISYFIASFPEGNAYVGRISQMLTEEWMRDVLADGRLHELDYSRLIDGHDRWFRLALIAVNLHGEDYVRYVMAATTEITDVMRERKRLEDDLRREMAMLRSFRNVYEQSYIIDVADASARTIVVPDDYAALIDAAGGDLARANELVIEQMIDPEYAPRMREFLDLADVDERFRDTNLQSVEYLCKDGLWRRGNLIVVARDSARHVIAIIYAVQQVDDEKTRELQYQEALREAAASAEKANLAKTEFLSQMSHDIRTPMNAIMGFSTLLLQDHSDPQKVESATRKILSSSQQLLVLINDVLDMSKIESGKVELNVRDFHLADAIAAVDQIIRPAMEAKGQDFRIRVSDLAQDEFLADEPRISQVLVNLLNNAHKYTQEGGTVSLLVRGLAATSNRYQRVEFVVKDNGMGMSEEFVRTIFDPFTREEREGMAQIQGTGLGMAITKNLVDLMGGTIDVQSKLDEGTTISFVLPLRIPDHEVDLSFWEDHSLTHMLVVDDEKDICENVVNTMQSTGVRCEYVLDGPSAVELVRTAHGECDDFNLVLLDWRMPNMDGIQTARELRQILPPEVMIIILTAYDWSNIEDEARAAGVSGFMMKPFFLSSFRDVVQTAVEGTQYAAGEKGAGAAPGEADAAAEDAVLEGLNVLAAEDNAINAEILGEVLRMNGATVTTMPNGREVLQRFAESTPGEFDLVLMDIQMPIMNGLEAARQIRALGREDAATIPIIAMTANAFADDVQRSLAAGMNAHVSKPMNIAALKHAVYQVLHEA